VDQPREAIYRAADQQVRNHGKDDCNDQCLSRIEPAKSNELIDGINNHRDDEDFTDCFPALFQHAPTLGFICEDGPEVGRPPFRCVVESRSNRKENRHRRLKHEAKLQRPGHARQQVVRYAREELLHGLPPENQVRRYGEPSE
jgi:hypothetical protein